VHGLWYVSYAFGQGQTGGTTADPCSGSGRVFLPDGVLIGKEKWTIRNESGKKFPVDRCSTGINEVDFNKS